MKLPSTVSFLSVSAIPEYFILPVQLLHTEFFLLVHRRTVHVLCLCRQRKKPPKCFIHFVHNSTSSLPAYRNI